MKRWFILITALVIAVGAAAPFLGADSFKPAIERALERGLNRKVEVGHVHFKLLTGPGFSLDDVRIYDDPRAGIEPLAYVRTLSGEVRLLGLFSRRLEFSSIRLGEASINLVKTSAGPWNFQFFAENMSAAPIATATPVAPGVQPPSIKMRSGRVNFKFGDTKSVFYFNDADLDVAPASDGSFELRFAGAPARTDQAAQTFGHFFVRGVSRPTPAGPHLDFKVELERSPVDDLTRLLDRRGFGVHGLVALEAQLAGPPSNVEIHGSLQIDDVHRWDLLPQRGGGWRFGYSGVLDLRGARLDLQTTADANDPPMVVGLRAWDLLTAPKWDSETRFKKFPAATVLEIVRHMSGALPENLAATGTVTGSIRYALATGLSGRVELEDASVTLPDAPSLRTARASVQMEENVVSLDPATVSVGEEESAELEGSYAIARPGELDLKINTRGLSVAALQSFHLAAIPWLEHTPEGKFRGWARYRSAVEPGAPAGGWSGEYELLNARIPIDGLAEPLRVQSAAVNLSGARVVVSRMRARAGKITFTGDYRWEPGTVRPHRFKLTIPSADSAELERLLAPALTRERGFLARTLGLGSSPALPAWLKSRRADGTIAVQALTVGDAVARIDSARVFWDSGAVRFAGIAGSVNEMPASGDLTVDLTGAQPRYRFEGKLAEVAYKGGRLAFDGWMESEGVGAELAANARAEGHFDGRAIQFAPDADFRSVGGCFEMFAGGANVRWKLTGLEVKQGAETYFGQGATQADGRLALDLASRGRQVHYTATPIVAPPPQ